MFYGEPLSESILPERDACKKGQQWEWNHVQFEFLHPAEIEAPDQLSANNHSCVLKITSGDFSFMLPGDIEENIESELVDKHAARLAANVLLAPHHGSNSSSSWPFIKSVDPDYVVFTSGYRNQFGHPAAEVIERYHQLGANMFTSSSSGAITFTVKEGKLSSVEEHRLQHKRYWF
jgi:competence protein ComEC